MLGLDFNHTQTTANTLRFSERLIGSQNDLFCVPQSYKTEDE